MNTLDCADIRAMLSGLVDDELDTETRHFAERHLGQCRPCRRLLDEAEQLDAMMAEDFEAVAAAPLPADFEAAVLSRIRGTSHGRPDVNNNDGPYRVRHWSWPNLVALTAAAAALVFSFIVWQRTAQSGTMPASPRETVALNDTGNADREHVETPDAGRYGNNAAVRITGTAPESLAELVHVPAANPPAAPSAAEPMTPAPVMRLELPAAPSDVQAPYVLVGQFSADAFTPLAEVDPDVMYAASIALRRLLDAPEDSFEVVQQVRSIVEYDELLPRLMAARLAVAPAERPVLFAVESVLDSVATGPVDM
ncbi:MAG: zf-HC2 domain-containing protein, partial [Phycisphaerales bacterium]|nr:zf-HC2 domain-containing protein [Phycisphaerales bacterium]